MGMERDLQRSDEVRSRYGFSWARRVVWPFVGLFTGISLVLFLNIEAENYWSKGLGALVTSLFSSAMFVAVFATRLAYIQIYGHHLDIKYLAPFRSDLHIDLSQFNWVETAWFGNTKVIVLKGPRDELIRFPYHAVDEPKRLVAELRKKIEMD